MEISKLVLGNLESNCYIVTNTAGDIAVIDPGFPQKCLMDALIPNRERVKLILLTHRHFDHLMGAAAVRELTGAQIAIHALDAVGLSSPQDSLAFYGGAHFGEKQIPVQADILLSDGDVLPLGELRFKVIHTPGHTAGGVCFVCGDVIFCGDTLFYESVGRTDFPTGNYGALMQSFRELAALEGDYRVLPGHYEDTTLDHERRHNPMAQIYDEI